MNLKVKIKQYKLKFEALKEQKITSKSDMLKLPCLLYSSLFAYSPDVTLRISILTYNTNNNIQHNNNKLRYQLILSH